MKKGSLLFTAVLIILWIVIFNPENVPASRSKASQERDQARLAGLIWLAKHQNPDGSWGAQSFPNQCPDRKCSAQGDGYFDIGVTGLALLAFTSVGYTQQSKDTYDDICFGDVVHKASSYLVDIQLSDGSFGGLKDGKFMYNQAVATYALCDVYALTMETPTGLLLKTPVESAVKFILESQNPRKGWRYQPKDGENDASVTGWVTLALKAAEQVNIPVPPKVFENIKSYYESITEKNAGRGGYTWVGSIALMAHEDPRTTVVQPTPTAIGVLVRLMLGNNTRDPLVVSGVKNIISRMPAWDASKPGTIDYYYWYYGSYCLYRYDGPGGENWRKWAEQKDKVILKNQRPKSGGCAAGSWDAIDRWGGEGGRVYSTAINIITLQ